MNETKVLSVSCQKGGVGKSLISMNLSYALSKLGYKTLLIDMDPQASSSYLLNVDITDENIPGIQTIFEKMINSMSTRTPLSKEDIQEAIRRPQYEDLVRENKKPVQKMFEFGFDLIPSNIELANYDIILNNITLNGVNVGGFVLTNIIRRIKQEFDYDFIILDVLPGLNMLAYNCLAAATDGNILPIVVEKSSITGGQNLLTCITEIQHLLWDRSNKIRHNGILGVVKNEYKPRLKVTKELDNDLFKYFGPAHIFETTIPTKATCDLAHSKGRLYGEVDKSVGEIFVELAKEVVNETDRRSTETEPVFIEKFGEEYLQELQENENNENL